MVKKLFQHLWRIIMLRRTRLRNHPFYLTISLFIMLLVFPVIQGEYDNQQGDPAELVLCVMFSLIMLTSIMVVWRHTILWIVIVIIGIPWVIMHWLEYARLFDFSHMPFLEATMLIIFSSAMFFLIMSHIASNETVTAHTIMNAVSAYLFIGIIWAGIYVLVTLHNNEALNTPDPLVAENFSDRWDTCVYYSFTTMTTVGFGDVTPLSPLARSLSVVESVIGALFLSIMIARLVGLYRRTKQVHEIEAYVEEQEGRNNDQTADS